MMADASLGPPGGGGKEGASAGLDPPTGVEAPTISPKKGLSHDSTQ